MRALLLAAGLGTRLRPFTFFRAKAALPFFHVPFLHFPLQYLKIHQITEVIINLHSHPETVRDAARKFTGGMKISFSHEPEILGTAGAIRKAASLLGHEEPIVIINGDMISDIPLAAVLQQHRDQKAFATLVVMPSDHFSHYSTLYFSEDQPPRLIGFQEGTGKPYHYTGLQIVEPEIYSYIPENKKTEIFRDIYPQRIQEKLIQGFVYEGLWKEIGSLKQYLQSSLEIHRHHLPAHLQPSGINYSLVAPSAKVEQRAQVKDSVIMEDAIIRSGAELDHCIVGWDHNVTGKHRNQALARGILPWQI